MARRGTFFLLLFLVPCVLNAQGEPGLLREKPRPAKERYFVEAGAMTMSMRLGRAYFTRVRFATQPESGFNILWGLAFMTNSLEGQYTYIEYTGFESTLLTGEKTHRDMFYTGVYFEYLIGSYFITPYISAGAVLGIYGSDNLCSGESPCESGPLLGFEPEMGLQLRPLDFIHVRMGFGTLLAYMYPLGIPEPTGEFSCGLRWLF